MMTHVYAQNGAFVDLPAVITTADGTTYPRAIVDTSDAAFLATIGVYELVPAVIPAGKIATSITRALKNGKVVETAVLEDAPAVDRTFEIEAEKLRRIEAGFPFAGKIIQSRAEDRENIAGAKSAAQDAKLLGALEGELDWQQKLDAEKGAPVFAWITLDNSLLPLDADSMIAMGYAAMLHKQAHIFAAKGLKDRVEAGETIADIAADQHWPG